jgi:hypothetical protein
MPISAKAIEIVMSMLAKALCVVAEKCGDVDPLIRTLVPRFL